jgi:hypothetical protein
MMEKRNTYGVWVHFMIPLQPAIRTSEDRSFRKRFIWKQDALVASCPLTNLADN